MTTTPARRLPNDPERVKHLDFEPGDYMGPIKGFTGDLPAVFYRLPEGTAGAGFGHVCSPPHTFRECSDGSLEIRASIGHRGYDDGPFAWHGYLDEGNVWRKV